ncbi:hypothetical protein [Roseobacter sp. CCS2]|uniref:hypothetical protein n=1 Tax=Roseobacter sp. CCS2 TaxID=391593 RepID=UPI0000F3E565|nr:hypothetical protein [Roseobacter sp. CCS2]EBA12688.1 hypothetical protein RCCS2_15364 [Roseobacter sp. CCS2]
MPTYRIDVSCHTTRDTTRFSDIPSDLIDRLTTEADRRCIIQRDAPIATRFVHQVIMTRRADVAARV